MSDKENWKDELQSAFLYRTLAEVEKNTPQSRLFKQLAQEAESQARIWIDPLPPWTPSLRAKWVASLIRFFGPRPILSLLAAYKVRGLSIYTHPLSAHLKPESADEIGSRHRHHPSSGNLRASIFGINDGIISNTLLILGFAGASMQNHELLLAGTAGLLAGAFSMAAGEYISVRSQKELLESQIAMERDELQKYPSEEAAELAMIYTAKGMEPHDAEKLAQRLIQNPELALETLAKEEIGIDPRSLGSATQASLFSFIFFSIGAFIPLLPLLVSKFPFSLFLSLLLSSLGLFLTGAFTAFLTGRNLWYGAFRMLFIGILAGFSIYGVGWVFGHHVI
jgi:VIT1/CCC1 family predicted Fe2+/Mn2+ transporter